MVKEYIKDGVVKSYVIEDNKVITTIEKDGCLIINPSLTDFLLCGYLEYTKPAPVASSPKVEVPEYTKDELIEKYIREHGYPNYGAELAVINNYACDAETYAEEYNTYMQVRQDAKQYAYDYLHPVTPEPAEGSTNEIEESNGEEVSVEESTEETIEEEVTNENPTE